MNQKKIKNMLVTLFILILFTMSTTACSNDANPAPSESLAIVTGVRSNVNNIANSPVLKNHIEKAIQNNGHIVLVSVESKPRVYLSSSLKMPETKGYSKTKINTIHEELNAEIRHYVASEGQATSPEADILESISLAADVLANTSNASKKKMLILDSGLSTVNYLNFTSGLLNDNITTDEIVKRLEKEKAIPDLSHVDLVEWAYLGQSAAPQEVLNKKQEAKLLEIWGTVLRLAGSKESVFLREVLPNNPYKNLPNVSCIQADAQAINIQPMKYIVLNDDKLSFVGDEATFIDENSARQTLKEVAKELDSYPENQIYVVGCTASSNGKNPDFTQALSTSRAETVIRVLTEYGICRDRLIPVGLGERHTSWRVNDLDVNGQQIDENAKRNRCVRLIDVNDPILGTEVASYITKN